MFNRWELPCGSALPADRHVLYVCLVQFATTSFDLVVFVSDGLLEAITTLTALHEFLHLRDVRHVRIALKIHSRVSLGKIAAAVGYSLSHKLHVSLFMT